MIVNKITTGYVIQKFDSKTGKCLSQEFIAGDEVNHELEDGSSIYDIDDEEGDADDIINSLEYCIFDMKQPKKI